VPQIVLKKQRVAKNGLVSYRFNTKRTSGVVYFDSKMFDGGSAAAPDTLTIDGDKLRDVSAEEAQAATEAAAKAAAAAPPAAEAAPAQ
jgi:hypothetical protein